MKQKAFIYIILAGVFWGTSGIFVHMLSPLGLSSLQMATVRGSVAAICMALYALVEKRELFKLTMKQFLLAVGSGFAMFMTSAGYFSSIQASSVSTAVVLMYTAPVMVMVYSVIFLGEKMTRLKAVSTVLMIVGCGLVSGIIGGLKFSIYGMIYGLISGVSYAAYNIFTKIQMREKCNPFSASMYAFIFMTVFALIVSQPLHIIGVAVDKPQSVLIMMGCGVITSVLPYVLYTLALKVLAAGTASALSVVEPMAATVFSIIFLGEDLNLYSVCGIMLIVFSIFMLSKSE